MIAALKSLWRALWREPLVVELARENSILTIEYERLLRENQRLLRDVIVLRSQLTPKQKTPYRN